MKRLMASFAFYTILPIPASWALEFEGIARLAPGVGLCLGGFLGGLEGGFMALGMPELTRAALVVVIWVWMTGGLHLDGVMDTADGLAVTDPQRRLTVMADSATGAFGAIAGGIILLLKTAALADLISASGAKSWLLKMVILAGVAGWGRWGQLFAIWCYPYLKPTGKGAFHQQAIQSIWDWIPSLLLLLAFSSLGVVFGGGTWLLSLKLIVGGVAIALFTGFWFNLKFGGHTGDTYGAIVEWTEALLLCFLTVFSR